KNILLNLKIMNKLIYFFLVIGLFLVSSCVDDNKLSPVDIADAKKDSELQPLFNEYSAQDSSFVANEGNYVSIVSNGNFLVLPSEEDYQGIEVELEKVLIKSPSEHTVDGEHFALELQFVHLSPSSSKEIVAVFVVEGQENSELNKIIPNISKRKKTELVQNLDFYNLFQQSPEYWTYSGSSTNDPFDDANWYIMKEPIEASADQIKKIQNLIGVNDVKQVELGERIILENF
ncbi:MAG: carbonic anhydrase family protein, partial [Bacteroidota bacterium]|nr:carbonic anhydrase family protein [Bacteroidota bacterium]